MLINDQIKMRILNVNSVPFFLQFWVATRFFHSTKDKECCICHLCCTLFAAIPRCGSLAFGYRTDSAGGWVLPGEAFNASESGVGWDRDRVSLFVVAGKRLEMKSKNEPISLSVSAQCFCFSSDWFPVLLPAGYYLASIGLHRDLNRPLRDSFHRK